MRRGLSKFSIPLIVAMLMSFVSVLGMSANAATLPTKLINGNFEYPGYSVLNSAMSAEEDSYLDWYIDVNGGKLLNTEKYSQPWAAIPNWNKSTFGWLSTQPRCDWGYGINQIIPAQTVQINVDSKTKKSFAELSIHTQSSIYQDLSTAPGSIYTWSLRHAPYKRRADAMSVMIGSTSKQTAQNATRETVNGNGDKLGFVGTVITTKGSTDDTHDLSGQWETYSGTYKIPDGQTTTRFTFATASAETAMNGNNLDSIVFDVAYPAIFDDNGGTGGPKSSYKDSNGVYQRYYHDGASIKAETDPTRSGYTFLGWSETKLGSITSQEQLQEQRGKILKHDALTMAAPGKTFYAVWGKNPTLTFDKNFTGSPLVQLPAQQTVKFGGSATRPTTWTSTANSIRKGYSFTGWKTSASSSTDYAFSALFSDTTVYAGWSANSYTIRFAGNGATSGSTASMSMRYDETRALNRNGFTYTGKTFAGWNTQPGGGGTSYSDGQSVKNLVESNGGEITLYAQWGTNVYTVTFMDGKTGGKISTATANYGSSVTPPSYPSHTGYTPTGWDKDTSRVTQNMTVTVNYRPNKYTIRFDGNATGVSGSMSDMQMEYDKAKNLTSNAFSLSGHSWLNWNTASAGNAKSYSNGQSVKNLTETDGGIVTLYAQWSTNAYTVTFVDGHDGTTISTARVSHGADAIPPTKPHHDGYTAMGWEGDYSGVTEDRTVTLSYRANRYRIAFDANGGSGTMPNQHLEYGKKSNLSANAFTRTGYSFAGWRLGSKDNGAKYSDGQEVLNLTDIDDGVLTMYAQWTPHSYTIRYDANGGNGSIADQQMTYDKADKLKANAFTRNGYTWAGWRRDDAATGTQYRNRQEVKNLLPDDGGSTTMYAQWTRNTYTVTFIDGFNGSTIGTVGAEYGQKAEAPTAPSHTGYTPSGWDSDFSNVTGDMTVTMGYRANRYRIEFDKNSVRASGSTAGMQMEYGKPANLTRNGFSLDGHDWLYWTDDADGNGRQYSDAQSVTDITADDGATVTLYAQWRIRRYTVTFIDGMTGDVISRTEVEHGGKATAPAIPPHAGYKATGWSKPFGSVTGDIETAIGYEPIRYTVAFDRNAAEAVGSMQKMGMSYGESKALAANAFSRPGYRFVGWGLKPEGRVSFNDCGVVENLTDVDGATVTLYAQWVERDAVHISYKASPADGGAVSNGEETLNPETGEAKGSTAEVATGYRFIGWYSGDTKVSDDAALIPVKPAGGWHDSSYEARFEKMRFTVSFVGKDGGELKEEEVEYGDRATAPDAPHVDGYEFIGWDKKFDNVTEDITVKALYRELPIAPAPAQPATPEPTPEPEPVDDGAEAGLVQTGVETTAAAVAMAIGAVSAAAVAIAARRKR